MVLGTVLTSGTAGMNLARNAALAAGNIVIGGGSGGSSWSSLSFRKSGTLATLDTVSYPGCTATAPSTVADKVSALRFDYWAYGSSGTPVALALNDAAFGTKLSFIDITLTVTPDSGTPVSHRSRVVLRNGAWGVSK